MPIILFIAAIIAFFIHLYFTKKEKSKKLIIELLCTYFIFFGFGIGGIIAFIAHVFFPYSTAYLIGWEGGSPFQFEVGMADLSFGVLAISCLFIKMRHFWLATIIGNTVFLWGCSIGHIRQMVINHNFSSGNAGMYFYNDIIFPIIIIGLYSWLMLLKKENESFE